MSRPPVRNLQRGDGGAGPLVSAAAAAHRDRRPAASRDAKVPPRCSQVQCQAGARASKNTSTTTNSTLLQLEFNGIFRTNIK